MLFLGCFLAVSWPLLGCIYDFIAAFQTRYSRRSSFSLPLGAERFSLFRDPSILRLQRGWVRELVAVSELCRFRDLPSPSFADSELHCLRPLPSTFSAGRRTLESFLRQAG
jgi:hypothetical protein